MFKKFEDDEDTGNHDYGDWDYKMSGLKFDSWKGMWQDTVLKTFSMKIIPLHMQQRRLILSILIL
jgi:hypothetical protein